MELLGQRFGNIRVTGVVGEGGMGAVYAAFDETLERKVALKVVHEELRLDSEARERLLREARSLSKLDHPNICRIHDYIHTSDSDLLVLEYIDGRTLTDVIRDKRTRAEKLRIAIAVAEVLVSAHRAGILHRDLKPDNVMLTQSGQVKVLDFGLARWMTRTHSSIATTSDSQVGILGELSRPSGALETQAGIAMGTPMYMSPEQARGEELTPASDMYAFGLLLQVLFTGQDPHPDFLGSREVMLRVARNETNPVQDAARDIAALIERLKQKAPADRPTAVETLEKLRWLAAKPARITRRSIAAAIVLMIVLGAWRYTVDLEQERAVAVAAEARAIAARADAEHRRDQADELIEFMIGDLRKKLEPVGRLDILDDVGNRTLAYIDDLDPATLTAAELARNAKAVNQLGEVRIGQGKSADAMPLFRRSLALTSAAVKREPRNTDALLVHGETHYWLANGLRLENKLDDALRHMREYMKTGDALAAIDPKSEKFQLERAYGHSGVGFVLEQKGDLAEAAKHYRVSLEVKKILAVRAPNDANAQAEVARAYNKVGVNLFNHADLRGAIEYLRQESEIYRTLIARDAKQTQWKQRRGTTLGTRAQILEMLGQREPALDLRREALAIEKELATHDPANVDWQRAMAVTLNAIGGLEAARGNASAAAQHMEAAWTTARGAMRSAPSQAPVAVSSAIIAADYGRFLAGRGDARGTALLEESVRILEKVPENRFARWQLCRSLTLLGTARKSPAEAAQTWERAERALPSPVKASSPIELAIWSRLLIHRGRTGEATEALAKLERAGYVTTELRRLSEGSPPVRQMAAGHQRKERKEHEQFSH